ncbi:phage tail tube protein [Glaciimonas soli]|uniref:Uncharacterized protein n=1 Tax=Glaciimonas soli TaxID=2590999 RepID=A0A843YXC4_9BURK|nr:hypothetical protein [Glaciimonas soli]MQR02324.1 hypothetical protein [Glaciimonas soli]
MSARGFLGAGDLYIARYDATLGDFGSYQGPYEATKFEIKPKVELKEMTSRGRSTYGQTIESVALQQPTEFTVELPEINKESLTIALLGTSTDINQASGTLTAETLIVKQGAWAQVSKGNLASKDIKLTNATGDKTYALGVDYDVNYRLGMLKPLALGAIKDGDTVKLTATFNAMTGTKIAGGTNAQIRARFKLDGKNFADDLPCIVTVHEGIIAADSAFDFLSDDFASISLPGRMKTPKGKGEPFTVELLDSAM